MLTVTMIKELHSYYHRGSRDNAGDGSDINKAIVATPLDSLTMNKSTAAA